MTRTWKCLQENFPRIKTKQVDISQYRLTLPEEPSIFSSDMLPPIHARLVTIFYSIKKVLSHLKSISRKIQNFPRCVFFCNHVWCRFSYLLEIWYSGWFCSVSIFRVEQYSMRSLGSKIQYNDKHVLSLWCRGFNL